MINPFGPEEINVVPVNASAMVDFPKSNVEITSGKERFLGEIQDGQENNNWWSYW